MKVLPPMSDTHFQIIRRLLHFGAQAGGMDVAHEASIAKHIFDSATDIPDLDTKSAAPNELVKPATGDKKPHSRAPQRKRRA